MASSSSHRDDGSDWDSAEEMEAESAETLCLFCSKLCKSPELVFKHCSEDHDFCISSLVAKLGLDCFSFIKMINYIRSKDITVESLQRIDASNVPWQDDKFLQPVLSDDLLLTYDVEDLEAGGDINKDAVTISQAEYTSLRQRLFQAEEAIEKMRYHRPRVQRLSTEHYPRFMSLHSSLVVSPPKKIAACSKRRLEIHLKFTGLNIICDVGSQNGCTPTEAYRKALEMNAETSIKGRVVLDVGCGTAILAMFAARCGASRVIGVDQSDIVFQAMDIVRENDLHGTVTLLKGRLEDIDLPVERVDVIVSEWMGYFLLFEGMLDTVLHARDHHLKPGGTLLPSRCDLFLVALCDKALHQRHIGFWGDVYGFKMSCLKKEVAREAHIMLVGSQSVCSVQPALVKSLDLNICNVEDTNFTSDFEFEVAPGADEITAFAGYFDSAFELPVPVVLSTSPQAEPTHWKQTVFLLEQPIAVRPGEKITGKLDCRRDARRRRELLVAITLRDQTYQYCLS
ncbi:protein arginine N-methyltransferase PRMT1, putative [Ixodes scapularis]|uniref:type I protein arginine methyltransferase n=1 Tax=Ixodes scapularis TaxID=6945 RepID=B7P426_IXOSC|nr:protein arginine N-methyltransferase PRMT1, putative [Ixodes scapularis]|eukprot:XP_002405180.1 protein arginine N-methyltransferase PRMT1, putative [Ixodes scapularis]